MKTKYTAIVRKSLSTPMKFLERFIDGDCLDYGCGRGFDCNYLGIDGYDPNWEFDLIKDKKYDTIFCNFVLNVVSEKEQWEIIEHIKSLLKDGGTAYLTVRRDIKSDYKVRGYVQRVVELPFESIYTLNNRFEIYRIGNV